MLSPDSVTSEENPPILSHHDISYQTQLKIYQNQTYLKCFN